MPGAPRTDPYVRDYLIRLLPRVKRTAFAPDRDVGFVVRAASIGPGDPCASRSCGLSGFCPAGRVARRARCSSGRRSAAGRYSPRSGSFPPPAPPRTIRLAANALFADLHGTMSLSDFPSPYIAVVLRRFTARTLAPCPRANDGISRFLRARLVCVRAGFDHAVSVQHSRVCDAPCCLPPMRGRRHPGV